MKMNKAMKKIMALVLVAVMSNTGSAMVVKAETKSVECTVHESYYNEEAGANFYGYTHQVEVKYYVEDEYGNKVDLSEVTGKKYYTTCTVTIEEVCVNVRCTKCNKKISTYYYAKPELHSYCAVG